MKKVFKWLSIILGSIIILVIITISYFYISSTRRLNKAYALKTEILEIPSDSASITRGKHLTLLCTDCHGTNLGGMEFFNDPALAVIYTPNLTMGEGGVGSNYNAGDWYRAIRHGVDKRSKPLFIMPSHSFNHLSKADLTSLIGYLNQIPPVNNTNVYTKYGFMGKLLLGANAFGPDIISAEIIDHDLPLTDTHPEETESIAYGQYLVNITGCTSCHAANYGGKQPAEPGAPYAPSINKSGNLKNWSKDQFKRCIQTGITPEGKTLNNKFMPFASLGQLTETELGAIYLYLNSVEPTLNKKD